MVAILDNSCDRSVAGIVKNCKIVDNSYQLFLTIFPFQQYLFWCAARFDNEELSTIATSLFLQYLGILYILYTLASVNHENQQLDH